MDRVTQTAITVAAIGAVAVAAGVVIGLQTHLGSSERTEQQPAAEQSLHAQSLPLDQTGDISESEEAQAVYIDDEIELSAFGEPVFDTETFNPVTNRSADAVVQDDAEEPQREDTRNDPPQNDRPQNDRPQNDRPQNEVKQNDALPKSPSDGAVQDSGSGDISGT